MGAPLPAGDDGHPAVKKILRAERFTARFECACGERFDLGVGHAAHVVAVVRAAVDEAAGVVALGEHRVTRLVGG